MPAFFFRELRALLRLTHVLWLIARGIITIRLFFGHWGDEQRRAMKQDWSRRLVAALGVSYSANQAELPAGILIVCNHISWLDVFILNAIAPTTFVCKDDVKSWPAIGWLVEHSGTLFIERGSRAAAARSAQAMAARLHAGERVAIFPEGTTTQGKSMLPFRPALFQAAVDAQVPVQPACLRYLDPAGNITIAPAYDGDLSFAQSMLNILRAPTLHAHMHFLPTLPPGTARRELTLQSESAIASALGFPLTP